MKIVIVTDGLTDEMFYFYHIAHMAKHFENGGCGVRSFMDQWILDHCVPHDILKRKELIEEGKLDKFMTATQNLAECWFSSKEIDDLSLRMEAYVLSGGIYGNTENGVAVRRFKTGGKMKYIFSRLFLSYDILKMQYPILQKNRWLVPVYQVCRWGRLILKGRLKRSLHELNVNHSMSKKQMQNTADLLKKLNL